MAETREEMIAKLRAEFFPETEEDEVEDETVEDEEEEVEDEVEEELEEDLEESEVDEPSGEEEFDVEEQPVKKPVSKEEKEQFAFKKLREEADSYKKKAVEYENKLKDLGELNELATSLGYKDYKEMVDANKRKLQDEEAKKKGIDPAIYRELQELKRRAKESEQREKTTTFLRTLDEFILENNLKQEDRGLIIQELDKDGWQLDKLLNYPNPKKLLRGYASDLIIERKTQKTIVEKKKFAEPKFKPEAPINEDVIDKEVALALKRHKERNNYK